MFKLPIVCYGCETPQGISKHIFRCINDTTENSEMCKVSRSIDRAIDQSAEKVRVITKAVFDELTISIPNAIKNTLNDLLDKISGLGNDIKNTIIDLYSKFTGFLSNTFTQIKSVVIKTLDQFYATIIKPIMDFISVQIVQPITQAIAMIVSFKEVVKIAITNAIRDVTGVMTSFTSKIIEPIMQIPKGIEYFINLLIRGLNTMVKGGVDVLNTSINGLLTGVEVIVNAITGGINKVISGLTSGINTAVNAVSQPIVNVINEILKFYNGVRDVNIGSWKPFGWLPEVNNLSFNGLNLNPPGIPRVDLPDVKVPYPGEIPEFSFAIIGDAIKDGFEKVFSGAKQGLQVIYDATMGPINSAIQNLTSLLASIYVTIRDFINKYLSIKFMKEVLAKIKEGLQFTVQEAIKIVTESIFKPIYTILLKIKDEIEKGINFIITTLRTIFLSILRKLNELFQKTTDVVYELSRFFLRNVVSIAFYYLTYVINIIIPGDMSKTSKLNLVIGIFLYIIYMFVMAILRTVIYGRYLLVLIIGIVVVMAIYIPAQQKTPLEPDFSEPKPTKPTKLGLGDDEENEDGEQEEVVEGDVGSEGEMPIEGEGDFGGGDFGGGDFGGGDFIEEFKVINNKTQKQTKVKLPYNCTNTYNTFKCINNAKLQYVN
jgi:hypothetical protein